MARRRVIEIICDRCGRVENQVPNQDDRREGPEFEARFRDRKVVFDDLCQACRKALGNYISKLARDSSPKGSSKKSSEDIPQIEKSGKKKDLQKT